MMQAPGAPTWLGLRVDGPNQQDQWLLTFTCAICGDVTQKSCSNPQRIPHWQSVYSQLHPYAPHTR